MRNLKKLPAAPGYGPVDNGPGTAIPSSRLQVTGDSTRLEQLTTNAGSPAVFQSSPPVPGVRKAGRL